MGSKLYEALAISEQHEPPHMKHRTELLNIKRERKEREGETRPNQ